MKREPITLTRGPLTPVQPTWQDLVDAAAAECDRRMIEIAEQERAEVRRAHERAGVARANALRDYRIRRKQMTP